MTKIHFADEHFYKYQSVSIYKEYVVNSAIYSLTTGYNLSLGLLQNQFQTTFGKK